MSKSFAAFWKAMQIECDDGECDLIVRKNALDYFENVIATANSQNNEMNLEGAFTKLCLHPLIYFPHLLAEDTSNAIRNWSNAPSFSYDKESKDAVNQLRKLTFTRLIENSQRIDITIRELCGVDEKERNYCKSCPIYTPLSYKSETSLDIALPLWRLYPLNIISHVELKRVSESVDSFIGQSKCAPRDTRQKYDIWSYIQLQNSSIHCGNSKGKGK